MFKAKQRRANSKRKELQMKAKNKYKQSNKAKEIKMDRSMV